MATQEVTVCDVYWVTKGVRPVHLKVEATDNSEVLMEGDVDLCPRAVKRLLKFIRRGILPPRSSEC